jgi:hypothetical protein
MSDNHGPKDHLYIEMWHTELPTKKPGDSDFLQGGLGSSGTHRQGPRAMELNLQAILAEA